MCSMRVRYGGASAVKACGPEDPVGAITIQSGIAIGLDKHHGAGKAFHRRAALVGMAERDAEKRAVLTTTFSGMKVAKPIFGTEPQYRAETRARSLPKNFPATVAESKMLPSHGIPEEADHEFAMLNYR